MKHLILDTRQKLNRATAVTFLVQLFGALGAGIFFTVQNVTGVQHILGAVDPANESALWFILFWATDFFFIAFTLVLSYLIAGLPAIALALSLAVYFAHFAGVPTAGKDVYFTFYSAPANGAGGVNIGYMGYFFMAIILSLLIKYLYAGWDFLKNKLGAWLDKKLDSMRKKQRKLPENLRGINIVEAVDLIVLVLLIPVLSAVFTWFVVKYCIQLPFTALADALFAPLQSLASSSVIPAAVVIGLMVGFDLIGPVSMTAFSVAAASAIGGDARLMTIYGACFITVGWIPIGAVLLDKIANKGKGSDTGDFNLATSGPINAFFENMKLTVAFSMPYAYRSPLTVIPGYMLGAAAAGLFTALFKIVNTAYVTEMPKYGVGKTFAQLFTQKEIYLSFTLPLRSGDFWHCRIPLFFIIIICGFIGGALIFALKKIETKIAKKRGTWAEPNGDIVIDLRAAASKYYKEYKSAK